MNNKEFEKINKEVLETVETNKKRSINEELHKKINERGEGYYYKLYRKKNGYTGTVWDEIDPKTENKASYIKKITVNNKEIKRNWSAKEIPATFIVDTNSGKVYVNSNSTKHLAQFVDGYTTQNPMLNRLNEQIILESYVNKIRKIAKNKIELNKMIILENWEFKFSIREGDEYPVLIHSQKF